MSHSRRPSSPLNPHSHLPSSSSPVSSPTPTTTSTSYFNHQYQPFASTSPLFSIPPSTSGSNHRSLPATRPTSTRYTRPSKRASLPSSPTLDLFSEGTTPTEGAMWRERFSRRMEERQRRKSKRDADLDKRRGVGVSSDASSGTGMEDEEAERIAQEDDEEIFRRLMVLQRRKAQHAALVAHEYEGSDPLPEWEDEIDSTDPINPQYTSCGIDNLPPPQNSVQVIRGETDEERWAREAAAAEEAEEAEMARRAEDVYAHSHDHGFSLVTSTQQVGSMDMDMDMDMDWEAFGSAMDIE